MWFRRKQLGGAVTADAAASIEAVYRGLLGRRPDAGGLRHWSEFLAGGGTLEGLIKSISRSDEYLGSGDGKGGAVTAPQLVRALYRGLLDRDPETQGFEHWIDFLRSGKDPVDLLRLFATSDEFLKLTAERGEERNRQTAASLKPAARQMVILSNCHGSNIQRCIQALTGTQPPNFFPVSLEYLRDLTACADALRAIHAAHEVLLVQPVFIAEIQKLFPELMDKVVPFPSISFAAFQPDQAYVRVKRTRGEVKGPLGPYHSAIIYHAWAHGLSAAQTVALFNEETFESLRYFDYWDSAYQAQMAEGRRAGIPLEAPFQKWRLRGCFMHSPNHPKLHVLADLSRLILQRLEIPTIAVDPLEYVHDNMAEQSVWPVYPEIAERLGVAGSYLFKGNNPGVPSRSPIVVFDLPEFVEASFASYEQYSAKEEIFCDRPLTDRYRKVLDRAKASRQVRRPQRKAAPATAEAAAAPRAAHPYVGLPSTQYWSSGVAKVAAAEVDPVVKPVFTVGRTSRVATAGSCFAQHIARNLGPRGLQFFDAEPAPEGLSPEEAHRRQFGIYSARFGNVYSARQLLQLFDRAHGEFGPTEPAWLRADGRYSDPFRPEVEPDGYASVAELEAARATHLAAVRQMFASLDVFVFTLGLTEAWQSLEDGAVFPVAPGVVAGQFDPQRHAFVNFGGAEVSADLDAFVRRLVRVNPAARVLLTVSPVPLAATYSPQHVLAATTYSKSVLRVAAEEMARRHANVGYFPSYEIITGNFNRGAYYDADLRSVTAAGVDHVLRLFFRHYAEDGETREVDPELLAEAERIYKIICEEEKLDAGRAS